MRFIICDDEDFFVKEFKNTITEYLDILNWNVIILTCDNGKNLLDLCQEQNVDVIFLDIDMPDINGFEVAKIIRSRYPKCLIIFCSNHNELVYDSFEYNPFWFLCKTNYKEKLPQVLDKIKNKLSSYNKELVWKTRETLFKIKQCDILFINHLKHKVLVHTLDRVYEFRGVLSQVENQLTPLEFVKINSGCIVNLEWVYKISDNLLILKNEELLTISRSNKKNVRNKFFDYLERE